MSMRPGEGDDEPPSEGAGGGARGLVVLVVVLVLVAGGVWLAQHMRAASRLQDCTMAGRTNCAPVQ